jgi:3-hydroxy-9,10-secoandrosta-1,3,5(10)-triene-9,17-dione monooxygenase
MKQCILDRPGVTAADVKLRSDLVRSAADLVPVLARNAQKTEADRRVVEENIDGLKDLGLLSLTRPKRYGGLEAGFRTNLEVTREIAKGCGSTAWTMNILNICAYFAGMWNKEAQDDLWDQPTNLISGVLTPSGTADAVDGGFVVSGRWGFASGSYHSQWSLVGIPLGGNCGEVEDQGLILIPNSELTIEDTWYVSGMRGTGSNTLVAKDVFVPAHRYLSMRKLLVGQTDNPLKEETLYRTPFMPAAEIVLAGPQLGLAAAALELVVGKASSRGITYTTYASQAEAPTFQLAIANAASMIDSAHLHAYRACADIDECAENDVFPDYVTRARIRMDMGKAISFARGAIRELLGAAGSSAFADANPLQRIWRDSEVAASHAVGNPAISAQVYGRALLGYTSGVTELL